MCKGSKSWVGNQSLAPIFCLAGLVLLLAVGLYALKSLFLRLQFNCERKKFCFGPCSPTASVLFLFWRLQCSCKYIPERFNACSAPANTFLNVSSLAAFLQIHFLTFWHLHKLCKHYFLSFGICISYASLKIFVFAFAYAMQALNV